MSAASTTKNVSKYDPVKATLDLFASIRSTKMTRFHSTDKLPSSILEVPGLGPQAVIKLQTVSKINTINQLISKYFALERQEKAFAEWLRSQGISECFANRAAYYINNKISSFFKTNRSNDAAFHN